ncbi:similar to An11g09530 [Aspergillus luchuensis IFO 4308]|nr:similar to An11g09530 [Aspergillus luchuensis IFO 4308]
MPDQQSIRLSHEVERLVTAPYAPSFQDLYSLTQSTTSQSIRLWASHKPCQIGALVDVLVDGLSRSRFALPLLETFVSAPAVRDALLERHPCLLDQFLQGAVGNDKAEYALVCTAILSSPLPPEFMIPARLTQFMEKMIRTMGEDPRAENILPLNQISNGIKRSPRLLEEIPSEVMASLQVELTKTLRNLSDHMGNLLCLATFARMASLEDPGTEKGCVRFVPSWLQSVNHFFGPKRGLKTLDLVVLRVILACSDSCSDLTVDKAAESIRLAIEICDRVEPEQRESWVKANGSKIAKLREKITRSGIDSGVQMLGATFLASLLPVAALSTDIARVAVDGLISRDSKFVLGVLTSEYIPRLVGASVACLGVTAIRSLLEYIVSSLDTTSSPSLTHILVAKSLVTGLHSASLNSAIFAEPLEQCQQVLWKIIESFPRNHALSSCHGSQECGAARSQLENELIYGFLSFYLHALLSQTTTQDTIAGNATLQMFLAQNKQLLHGQKCSFSEAESSRAAKTYTTLNVREGVSAPSSRSDWRSSMSETLMLNARVSNDSLMRKMEEVCYDLEQRCDDVEAPLRAMEQERNAISAEAQQLREQNGALELQVQQASDTMGGLRLEISRLETHAEAASIRAEELSATLDAARRDLEDQRREFQDNMASEVEKARTRELDLVASITERDDQLESLHDEMIAQRAENTNLQNALDEASKEKSSLIKTNDSLNQNLAGLEEKLRQSELLLVQKDEYKEQILSEKADTERGMEALRIQLEEERMKSRQLASTLEKTERGLQVEQETVRDYEAQLSAASTKYETQKEEIFSLRMAMQAAASDATKELQAKDKRIHHLEKKVQQLRNERAAKAREFSEAQQHIGRLMNVMGIRVDTDGTRPPSKQTRKSSARPSTTTMTQQTQPAELQTQPENSQVEPFENNLPSPPCRSPKRTMDNAFPPADPSSQQIRGGRKSRNVTPQHRRTPLEDADLNSQPCAQRSPASQRSECGTSDQVRTRASLEENQLQHIDLDMDLEFSKDFLFTSTSLSTANDPTQQ